MAIRENDEGGDTFIKGMKERIAAFQSAGQWAGELRVLSLPADVKDLNELHVQDSKTFSSRLEVLMSRATLVPVVTPGSVMPEPAGPVTAVSLGRALLESKHLSKLGPDLYAYDGSNYRECDHDALNELIIDQLESSGSSDRFNTSLSRNVQEFLRAKARRLPETPADHVINVENGLVDLRTGDLLRHSPDHLSTIQLGIEYLPSAKCPAWDRCLAEILPRDTHDAFDRMLGYLMVPAVWGQKAFLLNGPGGTGKSLLLDCLGRFLGEDVITHQKFVRWDSNTFATARVVGKLANICGELPSIRVDEVETFKMITGGDRLTVEKKYETSREVRPFIRLVFAGNTLPVAADPSGAYAQRLDHPAMRDGFPGGNQMKFRPTCWSRS